VGYMKKTLVIVESPTKAKTISKFLGKTYTVTSSFGHIRDLPKSKMGVDTEHGSFEPTYVIPKDKSKHVKELKDLAKKCDEILFATDEDREGEAISWHLMQVLDIDPKKAKRMVFHEITKSAIEEAIQKPRNLDMKLVDAQQARRILDRLVGYELSPLLWEKVARRLSAGRVQSVAVRLIVERELEIQAFNPKEYWTILGSFHSEKEKDYLISAKLHSIDGKRVQKMDLKTKDEVDAILKNLKDTKYTIQDIEQKDTKRTPPPPFTTSTLQQRANQTLGMSSKQTMRIAQQLYEGIELGGDGSLGLITYMRTDSLNLSQKFLADTKTHVINSFGKDYAIDKPRIYKTTSKGAQEAHEAIRPSDPTRTPESIKEYLNTQQFKLYRLIWNRTIATQMAQAQLKKTCIDIFQNQYIFRATGQILEFSGWLILYPELIKEEMLPKLQKGETLLCDELKSEQHFTEPPARYSDATLVKIMEEYGIGRPSTYAPTIATIETRHYVKRNEQKRLKPTDVAFVVNNLLVKHFPRIVDYQFTAEMEKNLDEIAQGIKKWQPIIATFYSPFHKLIKEKTKTLSKKELTEEKTDEVCDKCGNPMIIKMGRFGKFMACSHYPECKNTKPIGEEAELEKEVSDEVCNKCGKAMIIKRGRFGPFLGCSGYPECKNIKSIEKKTGVLCTKCGKGEFVQKRTHRGRTFYGCNQYPDCENALWSKPTGEICPECKSPIVFGAKGTIRCSNKKCSFKKIAETKKEE